MSENSPPPTVVANAVIGPIVIAEVATDGASPALAAAVGGGTGTGTGAGAETVHGELVSDENTFSAEDTTEVIQPGIVLVPAAAISGAIAVDATSAMVEGEWTEVDEEGNTALIRASIAGDISRVRNLLKKERVDEGVHIVNIRNRRGATALMLASLNGYNDIISELLEAGADVHLCDDMGGYPLVSAVCNGHLKCTQALLAAGADRDRSVDLPGAITTPLFEAVHSGNIEMVHLLLDSGVDIAKVDRDGRDALYRATNAKDVAVVELVVSYGRNVNDVTCYGGTLLMHYVTHCWLEGVSLLLRTDNNSDNSSSIDNISTGTITTAIKIDAQDNTGRTALIHAVICRWFAGVQLLLDHQANLHTEDYDSMVALVYAAENNDVIIVQLLLSAITALRQETGTYFPVYVGHALIGAARSGHANMVSMLLGFDASVINNTDDSGDTALMEAASRSHMMVVEVLLAWRGEEGENSPASAPAAVDLEVVNEEGDTVLTAAVKRGFTRLVKMLLEAGAAVNHVPLGVSPLLLAVSNNYELSCPRLLLEYGADPNSVTPNGTTALMLAVTSPSKEALVPELVEAGAYVNARDNLRETVLHKAAKTRTCSLETMLVLLTNGVDVNAQTDLNRETALIFATKRLWIKGIRALLAHDADTEKKDTQDRGAIDWARQQRLLFPRPSDSLMQAAEEVEDMLQRQSKWRKRRYFIMSVLAYFKQQQQLQRDSTTTAVVPAAFHSVACDRCLGNMDMCYAIATYL